MIISPNQSNHPISARVRSMLIDPPSQHPTSKMATSAPPYRFGSVSSLVDQHNSNMNNQNNRRSMDGSGVGGAVPVEGRRRARQLQGRPLMNDPYKRASLHEPLMYDGFRQSPINFNSPPINFNSPSKSTPLGGRRSHAASTLAIPNLVASMDSMNGPGQRSSYAFGSDRSSPHFINPANQNFILRKSKSTIYDEHFEQSPKGGFRDRNAFPSVDEGVDYDGPYSDDDDEDEDDDDLEDSSTFDLKNSRANTFHHQDSFPTYNPILPSNSYSASSSWLGGLFAPRFTTVSANTAAKSASLSFQQMKSFSGFGQSMDLYDDDLAHMHEISRERKHSTASFIANNTPSIRDRSQTIDSANVDVHHHPPPHHQSSISIPYSALSVDHGHHHPYHDLNSCVKSQIPTLNNSHHNESISSGASSSVLRSMKSHANLGYSSSSGCSTQSSASSNHSISQHFVRNNKARSSLKEAAQNFRDFVQHYELGLIECISSVEESQQQQQMNNHHQQMNNQLDLEQVVAAGGSTANNNIASTNGVGMKNRLDHEVVGGDCGGEHEEKEGENGDDDDRRHSEQHDDEQQSRVSPAVQTSTMLPNDNSMSPVDLSSSDHHHHNATSSPNSPSPDAIATNEGDESPTTSPTSPTNESSSLSSPSSPPPSPTSPTSPNLSRSLRLQLAKVRALRDQYETGYRCSEALERLMKVSKRPRDCDREYRANERLMAEIEAQLEAMIGTFRIKVEELEGFARICPRDNYEIEFRHGKQRRVLRVRIGKALERNWDGGTQEVEFRGALKPTIVCRVREIKSRWTVAFSKRNVTLGVTSISMSDLLVAVSKGSTIMMDANASGSLKLRVSCSWQPKLMDGEGGTDSTKSSTKESSTKLPLVNQSFRSENLDFVSRSSAELQPDRPPKKASTLTSQNFSTSYPSNCTIPESPKSPSKGAPPPISAKPKFLNGFNNGSSNLNRSGDLSRSLLALPSFYYSSSSPNKMMNPKSKDSSSPRAASKSRDFQSTFCLSSPQHRRFPSLNSSLNSSSSSQSLSSSSQHNANSTDNLMMTTPDNGSLNSTPSSTLSRSESNRKATAPISTQSSVNQTTTTNSDQVQAKVSQLTSELCNLQSALEDYRGQYVELTMMSITVGRLFDYYDDLVIEDYHDDDAEEVHVEEIDQMILEEEKDYEIIAASGVIDQNQSKFDKENGNGENEEAAPKASKSKLATTENRNEQPEQPTMIDDIETALAEFDFLECASQYSEKSKDEDNSSARSTPTAMDNATGTGDGSMMKKGQIATDNQDNRLMGRNSLHPSPSSNKCVTSSSTNLLPESSKNRTITSESSKLKFLDLWSSVLLLHLNSSLEQLGHVGSWILKGREAQSLARLRADAFAFELIYELLISNGRTNPLGKDRRVIELWQFASDRLSKSDKGSRYRPYIMSWRQLCQILIDLMLEYGLGGTTPTSHLDDPQLVDDDALRYAAEWLSGLMVPLNQTKVTLFDLRAFFELDLWRSARGTGNSASLDRRNSLLRNGSIPNGNGSGPNQQNHQQSLSIKRMFQIALDVDKLMRKCKKISLHSLEQILFDRFNVNCLWIPSDVTLTIVGLLYENHSQEKQSKLTTSEVKKLDRFREMGKMATNWIIWLLQDGRFEIREHVLSGLESSTAFTRRASCYGIMYMFKLMKRSSQYEQQNNHRQPPPDIIPGSNSSSRRNSAASSSVGFFGQELDSLLYVSMEDHDGRVRDEARKALKCLGHYGQQRLNQMERSRMGFVGTAGAGASGNGPQKGKGNGQQPVNMLGRSMPNLNKIV